MAKKRSSRKKSSKKSKARASSDVNELPTQRTCACDEVHERLLRQSPGYADARAAVENHCWRAMRSGAVGRSGCTRIPVVVHVVHRTAAENISDAQIQSQMEVLNQDFRKKNADLSNIPAVFASLAEDARIEFALATEDPDGNPTSGITRTSTSKTSFGSDDGVKFASSGGHDAWPRDRYLNIWVCRLSGGLLGYAQFPGGPANTDGVVVTHTAFGTEGTAAAPFDRGRTTTHEIGHWLNLRHIWGDDGTGCSGSDFVADTPNQGGPNHGTPTFPNITCGNGPNGDLFMNYMDYVDDQAMFMFTSGQVARMQAALDGPRSGIGTSIPCGGPAPKPPTDDPTLKFVDDPPTIKFIDDIPGGGSPPTVKFVDDPGSFKFTDDVKTPTQDKPPFADLPFPRPPFGGFDPNRAGIGAAPFVLSTPHHSTAWTGTFPGAAQARMNELQQQLTMLHYQLSAAQQAMAAGTLSAADQAAAQQIYQEYQRLMAEYSQMV